MRKFQLSILLSFCSLISIFAQVQIGSNVLGENSGDRFGKSVALSSDGNRLAVGANLNNGNGMHAGHVRVFEMISGSWVQIGNDIDGEATDDNSGFSVSLSTDGTRVAIGAYVNDGNGSNSGHVRVFEESNGLWSQVGGDIDGEATGDNSGFSVSLSTNGTRIAIGAYVNDGNGNNSGHVRVFEESNGLWSQLGGDIDGEAAYDGSGVSVSLSGDGTRVAIGAHLNDGNGENSGHTRIYRLVNSSWIQIGSDIDGEASGDLSGISVSLSANGKRVAIGAYGNDGSFQNSGHVRVFGENNGNWTKIGNDIDGEFSGDNSGRSISLSSNGARIAVASEENDGNGSDSGHVRVFEEIFGSWVQIGQDIDGEFSGDRSGSSVALSGDGSVVAIGARFNDENGIDAGNVRIFNTTTILPVEILTFTGNMKDEYIGLNWETTYEQNNRGFYIEKSSNGKQWNSIGFIEGKRMSVEKSLYEFQDFNPKEGTNYYRLKQVDFDGEITYSNSIQIQFIGLPVVTIFPNPAKKKIKIQISNLSRQRISYKIFDITGRMILINTSEKNETIYREEVYIEDSGLYQLVVFVGNNLFYDKIIIIRD